MFDYIMLKVWCLRGSRVRSRGVWGPSPCSRSQDGISTRNKPPSGHDGTAIAINRHVYQSLTNDAFKTRVKIPYLLLGDKKPCGFQCLYLRDVFKKKKTIQNFNQRRM